MRAGWAAAVAFRAAWECLRRHRWRSILTFAVCGLGTAGVINAGLLAKANSIEVQTRFRSLGGGLIVVSPNKLPPYPGRERQLDHFISLEPEDAGALAAEIPQVQAVVPVVARSGTARFGGTATRVRMIGTTSDFFQVRSFTLNHGRFFLPADGGERVVILGHAVSQELVPGGVPPGQEVQLNTTPYLVVGILRPQGVNFAGEDEDHQVFIPLDTYRRRLANRPWLSHLYLQLSPEADSSLTAARVQGLLRERHQRWDGQVDDVIVRDLADVTAREASLLTTTTWAVSVTSGLLLIMGGMGITTLMVLVVRQRQTEIALRRAVGATPADVALQFFLEGTLLSATGVLGGLIAGCAGALILVHVLNLPAALDPTLIAISAAVSLACSAAGSTVPAILAARTEPGIVLRA